MPSLSPAHNKPPDRGNQKKHALSSSSSHPHSPSPSYSHQMTSSHPHPSLTRKPTSSSKGFLLSNTRVTRRRIIVLLIGSILLVLVWKTIIPSSLTGDVNEDGHPNDQRGRSPHRSSAPKRSGAVIKPVWLGSTGPKGRDGSIVPPGSGAAGSGGNKLIIAGFEDEVLDGGVDETDYYADEKRMKKQKNRERGRLVVNVNVQENVEAPHQPRHPHAKPTEGDSRPDGSSDDKHKIVGEWKTKPRKGKPELGPGQKKHPAQPYRPRKKAEGGLEEEVGLFKGGRFGPARMDPQDEGEGGDHDEHDEHDEHEEREPQEEQVFRVGERGYDPGGEWEEERQQGEDEVEVSRPERHSPLGRHGGGVKGRGRYQQRPNIVDAPELEEQREEEDSAFKGWDEEDGAKEAISNGLSRLGEDAELEDEMDSEVENEAEDEAESELVDQMDKPEVAEQEDELVERHQVVMDAKDDERWTSNNTDDAADDLSMFQWADDSGLRILTEKDLYGTKEDKGAEESTAKTADERFILSPNPDDEQEMTPEQEWQAHLDRIQKMKERNRIENRRPIGVGLDEPPRESDYEAFREDEGEPRLEQEMDDGSQWMEDWEEEDEGECEFMSVVDAYQMALTRLRKAKLAESTEIDAEDDRQTDQEELTDADYERFSHPGLASHIPPKTPGAHRFSRTGHLVLSEDEENAEHPIPQLLKLGERRWQEMVGRQSKTLAEAVDEYKRRYGRQPPRGFDLWWDFAAKNSLLLPDEYDRIHLDLAPFWALPRAEMRQRVREAMDLKETFVLVVENGTVSVEVRDQGGLDWGGTLPRAKDAASLIRPFSEYMPDMRAVFSIHDQPQIYLSATRRASLVELGLRGEHTSHLRESDSSDIRWERSCSRESNLRTPTKHEIDEAGSLVYDTQEASDICKNPYLMDLHGFTVEKRGPASHPKPRTSLIPLFGLAKTSVNSDILVTPLDQFADAPGFDPPWKYKRSDRIAWRGSTTGISWMDKDTPWRKSHRFRLHDFAGNRSTEEVSFVVPDLGPEGGPLKIRRETGITKDLSEFFYDMKLAGEPLQCDEKDGTCDEMDSAIEFADHQPAEELNGYKFLFDIDGNSWSGRFRRLMNTKSLVLKTGIFTEWFQPHLIPWFSYIPTRLDFSDLPMIMSFLRGSPEAPNDGFDEVAEAIASNGRCFTKKVFRVEDMQAYMFRLFLEYARLMAPTDENVDFVYDAPVAEADGAN